MTENESVWDAGLTPTASRRERESLHERGPEPTADALARVEQAVDGLTQIMTRQSLLIDRLNVEMTHLKVECRQLNGRLTAELDSALRASSPTPSAQPETTRDDPEHSASSR